MKLAIGICLTAIGFTLSLANAKPNPEANAKPLTVKAHVGVNLNSGESPSAKDGCGDMKEGQLPPCLQSGEKGCNLNCGRHCCQGLNCMGPGHGVCLPRISIGYP